MMLRTTLRSDRLTCPSCVAKIERALGRMDGVHAVHVAFTSGRIDLEHEERVAPDAFVKTIGRLGYPSRVAEF